MIEEHKFHIFEDGEWLFRPNEDHLLFGELIGDISQDVMECSYNDDWVLELWQTKQLNDRLRNLDKWAHHRFFDKMPEADIARYKELSESDTIDWEMVFDKLYVLCEGWPTGWLSDFTKLENLDTSYDWAVKKS